MRKLVFALSVFCLVAILAVAQQPGGTTGKRPPTKDKSTQNGQTGGSPKTTRDKNTTPKKDTTKKVDPSRKDATYKDRKVSPGGSGGTSGGAGQPGQKK